MKIAIIGMGAVGGTLGRLWAGRSHEVTFGVRDPQSEKTRARLAALPAPARPRAATIREAAEAAEVIALATPWDATQEAVRAAGDLSGKILVDCTNPLAADFSLAVGHTTSAAETVAAWAPGARVVKAFNTTGSDNFDASRYGDRRAAMFICGDDTAAKGAVSTLASDLGFEVVDSGPLANARLLEPVASLWIWLAFNGQGRDFAFGLLRR